MRLSIIIVNWNSAACLRDCLRSLVRHASLADTEVIVLDNGSFDGSHALVAAEFPGVVFLQLAHNLGFARANNLGAARATGRHLLFLNPDTLLHEDTPARLAACLDADPQRGAAGGRVLNRDATLQTSCVQSFPTLLNQVLDSRWLRARFPRSRLWGNAALDSATAAPVGVEALSGACLAVRRSAFEQVGGFTERYFMYGEDIDLCRKLHDAGWDVVFTPTTSLVHLGGESSRQSPGNFSVLMQRRAIEHYFLLHRGATAAYFYRASMGAAALLRLLLLALVPEGDTTGSQRKWRAILRWSVGLSGRHARPAQPWRHVAAS